MQPGEGPAICSPHIESASPKSQIVIRIRTPAANRNLTGSTADLLFPGRDPLAAMPALAPANDFAATAAPGVDHVEVPASTLAAFQATRGIIRRQ
jgi:hypothetical protein